MQSLFKNLFMSEGEASASSYECRRICITVMSERHVCSLHGWEKKTHVFLSWVKERHVCYFHEWRKDMCVSFVSEGGTWASFHEWGTYVFFSWVRKKIMYVPFVRERYMCSFYRRETSAVYFVRRGCARHISHAANCDRFGVHLAARLTCVSIVCSLRREQRQRASLAFLWKSQRFLYMIKSHRTCLRAVCELKTSQEPRGPWVPWRFFP